MLRLGPNCRAAPQRRVPAPSLPSARVRVTVRRMTSLVLVAWAFVVAAIPGVMRALLARLVGMRVPALVIGVGPVVAAAQLGLTRLELRLVPFGAYSRVAGFSPVAEPVAHDAADAYGNRPLVARALVSFA